jgi:DNA polymerase
VENITQAVARDVLAANLKSVEDAGYKIVLSVHDELITETPDTLDYNADKLASLMATAPEWAKDLPLSAAGFEAYRYKKD